MVKTLVLSFGTVSLAALGALGFSGGQQPTPDGTTGGCCGPSAECCGSEPQPATIECDSGACVIRFTTADGRAGAIELACAEGECKVTSCTPCGTEPSSATPAATACCAGAPKK